MLARARPPRALSGGFFDRLGTIRRVAMAEVAKAPDLQSALAVLGVVLDREALLLAAEEAEDPEPAKAKVLSARPGNYAELACELSAHLRQGVAQGKRAGAPRPPKRAAG